MSTAPNQSESWSENQSPYFLGSALQVSRVTTPTVADPVPKGQRGPRIHNWLKQFDLRKPWLAISLWFGLKMKILLVDDVGYFSKHLSFVFLRILLRIFRFCGLRPMYAWYYIGSCSIFSDRKVKHEILQKPVDSLLAAVCSRALRSEEGRTLGGNSLLIVLMVMSTLYGEGDRATRQLFLFSVEVACAAYSTVHPLSTTLYGTVSAQPLLLLYHVLYFIIDACAEPARASMYSSSFINRCARAVRCACTLVIQHYYC